MIKKSYVTTTVQAESLPTSFYDGAKADISNAAAQLTATNSPLKRGALIKLRSLGTGTYVAIGNSTSQNYRLTTVGDAVFIDWIDNLNKIYVITDVGTTGAVEWNGA